MNSRFLLRCITFVVAGSLLVACSDSPSSLPAEFDWASLPSATPTTYTSGTPVMVAETTVDAAGGVLQGAAGTPVEGVVVTVPAGALGQPTVLRLGYDNGSFSNASPDDLSGVVLVLESSGTRVFEQPLKIEFPFKDPQRIPVPYYLRDDGRLEVVVALPVDRVAKRGGFLTWHASNFTWMNVGNPKLPAVWNKFHPAVDGFAFKNGTSPYAPNGRCWGISDFSLWYKNTAGGNLASQFGDQVPTATGAGSTLSAQDMVATRSHNSVALKSPTLMSLEPVEFITGVKDALSRGATGVLVGLADPAHVVLAIAYTDNQIAFYDSNWPGVFKAVDYSLNPPSLVYGTERAMGYWGDGQLVFNETREQILADAKAGFHNENETKIEITSHQNGAKVDKEIVLEGKIRSGQLLASEIEMYVKYPDGSLAQPKTLPMPPQDNTFIFPLTLQNGENQIWFVTRGQVAYVGLKETPNDHQEGKFHLRVQASSKGTGGFAVDYKNDVIPNTVFQVEALATLTMDVDTLTDTSYVIGGTATMKTQSFTTNLANCVLKVGAVPIGPDDGLLTVLRGPPAAVNLSYAGSWDYTCTSSYGSSDMSVTVSFDTITGPSCSQSADVPTADPLAPTGSFTQDCYAPVVSTASWNFILQ
jgi:hypothetical protein